MTDASHVPWSIDIQTIDGATRLRLRGELDAATAVELGRCIAASDTSEVHVDMAGVTFMDSSGLAAVLEGHRVLAAQQRRLVVRERSDVVQRVMDLAGVTAHIDAGRGQGE